jgi:hypothetical protein
VIPEEIIDRWANAPLPEATPTPHKLEKFSFELPSPMPPVKQNEPRNVKIEPLSRLAMTVYKTPDISEDWFVNEDDSMSSPPGLDYSFF